MIRHGLPKCSINSGCWSVESRGASSRQDGPFWAAHSLPGDRPGPVLTLSVPTLDDTRGSTSPRPPDRR